MAFALSHLSNSDEFNGSLGRSRFPMEGLPLNAGALPSGNVLVLKATRGL
jgi:hypothetical protein